MRPLDWWRARRCTGAHALAPGTSTLARQAAAASARRARRREVFRVRPIPRRRPHHLCLVPRDRQTRRRARLKDPFLTFDEKGKEFEEGKLTLEDLREFALANGEPAQISGKQEWLENLVNHFI